MSQIHYDAISEKHGPVHVQTGWDPTLQHFHVTVWAEEEEEDVIVDDMLRARPPTKVAETLMMLLAEDIPVPKCLPDMLSAHQFNNEGNTIITIEYIQ